MDQANSHKHSFPLEQLFLRLDMAGFALSPADRLRALQILSGPAKAYLDEPEQLKKLLAPALVRSATEQEKFYEIFDLYLKEINKPPEVQKEEEEENSFHEWLPWLILAIVASLIAFSGYSMWNKAPASTGLSIYIEGPTYASVGDTLPFLNLSKYSGDSSELKWQWEYGTPGQEPELLDTSNFDWTFVVPPLTNSVFQKEVRLSVYYPEKDSIFESRVDLSIFCPSPPAVNKIIGPKQLNAGQNGTFTTAASEDELEIIKVGGRDVISGRASNWTFDWDFGDGTSEEKGSYFTRHQYEKNGLYRLRLTVTDTTGDGFCSTTHSLEVKVGAEQAFLPLATLEEDRLKPIAVWDWAYYVLLGLLGIGIIYHWVRWLTRPKARKENESESPEQKALRARFELNDKAPYFIPLRDQNQHIQSTSEYLRFADALRLRQEGLRKNIDVKATLNATIDGGGFPSVQYRYSTQPSEYLFLIDEQSRASHLGRLFTYLAESLSSQDVNVEIFYYRLHFNRFWNHYHPSGFTIDQLRKNFPNYRLVVLGDLHELIDPHAKTQPQLRPEFFNIIKQWPQRLLLSPVPPVSWSYREKLLAKLFSVFPADVDGIISATVHLENEAKLTTSGSAFDKWKESQLELRQDSDTEHRRWRRWRDIDNYLKGYDQELTRWFTALAVFPMVSWEMTIAIGRSLDIEITHDKLLQLARIPALQQDRFDERLRQELLAVLNKHDEALARKAVRIELESVKAITTDSSASRDLETTLAIQSFSLDPEAEENQDTIRFLLEKGILSPGQENELDWVSSKHVGQEEQALKTSSSVSKKPSVNTREWLNAADYVSKQNNADQEKNRFNKDFWKALLLSLAYTLMLIAGWKLGGSDQLYKMVFWENPKERIVGANDPLKNYYFVKENLVIDSAIIYNNLGVESSGAPEAQDTSTAHYFQKALAKANIVLKGNGENFQGKDITYSLANANLARLYYNVGANYLNQYLNDSLGQAVLPEALTIMDKAYISDSVALDVLHAKGVIHYYMGSPEDSVNYYYQLLDTIGYFSSSNGANLKTLLGLQRSYIIDVNVNQKRNQELDVLVNYFLNDAVDKDVYLSVTPVGSGTQPKQEVVDLEGLVTPVVNFKPSSQSPGKLTSFLVELHRRPSNDVIDSKEIPYQHNWAAPKPDPRDRQQGTPEQNVLAESLSFYFRGKVIDDINRKGIAGARVVFKEDQTRSNRKHLRIEAITDAYGDFSFEGQIPAEARSPLTITTTKRGYQDQENSYTKEEISSFDTKEGLLIRVKTEVAKPNLNLINGGRFERMDESDGFVQKTAPTPQTVTVSNFFMSPYEITYAEYDLFCELTSREKADDNGWGRESLPLTQITWADAIEYCNWLSDQHGYTPVYERGKGAVRINTSANGYRLPTEAEWEYAARGGIMGNKDHIYAGSADDIDAVAWYDNNSNNRAHRVGQKKPNNAGLYDMSGNVWEWCQDWYAPYSSRPERNPLGGAEGSHRIIRGGAWIQQAADCRIDFRRYIKPNEKHSWLGFRLVRSDL